MPSSCAAADLLPPQSASTRRMCSASTSASVATELRLETPLLSAACGRSGSASAALISSRRQVHELEHLGVVHQRRAMDRGQSSAPC